MVANPPAKAKIPATIAHNKLLRFMLLWPYHPALSSPMKLISTLRNTSINIFGNDANVVYSSNDLVTPAVPLPL
jgi:hypothetical protein